MKIYFFCHSVISDWNHGNAHTCDHRAVELMKIVSVIRSGKFERELNGVSVER
ncbi:MAG TPA: hypothetical protein VK155_04385 [Bacteroidales bacterium]|nr:hypothetical protein [Bacteroidales bacterium]